MEDQNERMFQEINCLFMDSFIPCECYLVDYMEKFVAPHFSIDQLINDSYILTLE